MTIFPQKDKSHLQERLDIIQKQNAEENEKLQLKHQNALLFIKMQSNARALEVVKQQNKALHIEMQIQQELQNQSSQRPNTTKQRTRAKTPNNNRTYTKNKTQIVPEPPHINDNEQLTTKKAQKLMDTYRHQLMLAYMDYFIKEKEKDKERENELKEVNDDVTKRRLARIQAMQRAQSADKK